MLPALALIALCYAQEFEAASVRPSKAEGSGTRIQTTNGTYRASNVSLFNLLLNAFGVQPIQLLGVENWMKDERFDINANFENPEKLTADAKTALHRARLQHLLVKRFQLKFHEETRELPIFALVIDKQQHKMKTSAGNGSTNVNQSNGSGMLNSTGLRMSDLIHTIGAIVQRNVVDETGLGEQAFELELRWSDAATNAEGGPTIFTALREQLGLRLEPKKGPVKVYVVDQAARPSEN